MTQQNKQVGLIRHLQFAAFCGLVAGIFFGHIDLVTRVVLGNYEWFEIYLSLLMPAYIFVLLFLIIALLVHLPLKTLKIALKADALAYYYFVSISFFFLLVAVLLFINLYLFGSESFWGTLSLETNILSVLLIFVLYALTLKKGKDAIIAGFSLSQIKRLNKLLKDYIFFICFFIVVSALIDLWQIHQIKRPVNKTQANINQPNILLISLDTTNAKHLSLYGYAKKTSPNLDKLASNSVVFDKAYSTSSWTLPAHASVFTGKFPYNHKAHRSHQQLNVTENTLAEILHKAGYATAGFIGGPYSKAKWGFGQGFEVYKDRIDYFEYRLTNDHLSIRRIIEFISKDLHHFLFKADRQRTSPEINKDVFSWLEGVKAQPFFLFVNYFDAHDPYVLGSEYRHLFTDETRDYSEIYWLMDHLYSDLKRYENNEIDDATLKYMEALYDTEIYYQDRSMQKLLDKLEALGHLENTLVIIFGDHGEEFLEHGGVFHVQTLYNELIQIPLLISLPKHFSSARLKQKVGILDIFPTVLDFLSIKSPTKIDGESLLPLMSDRTPMKRDYILAERFERPAEMESMLRALIKGKWKLIEVNPERKRTPSSLFNLETDPLELNNLYHADLEKRKEMEKLLNRLR